MKVIKKKILPEYFEAILIGQKKYELRLNDFDASEGDTLLLEEYTKEGNPTGRTLSKKITSVGKFKIDELHWPKEEVIEKGLQIFSLE